MFEACRPRLRCASALWLCGLSWLGWGCRLGGGSPVISVEDDIADFVEERGDAAVSGRPEVPASEAPAAPEPPADVAPPAADGGRDGRPASDPPTQQPAGAPARGTAGAAGSGRLDAGTPPGRAPSQPGTTRCGASADIPVCNPISNTGCAAELGMQCDVDLLAPELAGQCVFSAPPPDAGSCLNIPPTESCPAGSTCVDFSACRKLCLCDDDCEAGECCRDALGEQGFKLCGAC